METVIQNKETSLYTIFYTNSGKETVILLHGGPGVPEDLSFLISFLTPQYQVIYFHQRGTLRSPCPSGIYSMESYISDIDCIAAHFKLDQFHLFGHSWGGLYAQIYASQRPEKLLSMFLSNPASGTGLQWVEMANEIRRFNKSSSSVSEWLAMCQNALLGMLGSNTAYRRFYRQFGLNCNKGHGLYNFAPLLIDHLRAQAINRTNRNVLLHSKPASIEHSSIAITVVYGDADIYGDSPKYVRERYPMGKFVVIQESGHNPWLHNSRAFQDALAAHYGF